jgi:Rrf2 family protein
MKVNSKVRYGLRVMIELALTSQKEGYQKEGIYQKEIAKNQDISFKYLDQIIAGLKSSGLISTVAGKKSGYRLTRDPDKITILEVYNAFNPEFAVVDCLIDGNNCRKNSKCATRYFWEGLNSIIINYMRSTTINDLAKKQKELNQEPQELIFHI